MPRVRAKRDFQYGRRFVTAGSVVTVTNRLLSEPVEWFIRRGWFELAPKPVKRKGKDDGGTE